MPVVSDGEGRRIDVAMPPLPPLPPTDRRPVFPAAFRADGTGRYRTGRASPCERVLRGHPSPPLPIPVVTRGGGLGPACGTRCGDGARTGDPGAVAVHPGAPRALRAVRLVVRVVAGECAR